MSMHQISYNIAKLIDIFITKEINAKKNELRIQSKKLATVQKNEVKEIRHKEIIEVRVEINGALGWLS